MAVFLLHLRQPLYSVSTSDLLVRLQLNVVRSLVSTEGFRFGFLHV